MLKDLFRQMILDFHARPWPESFPRALQISPMKGKALALVGVRRCGKSTLLLQLAQKLEQTGSSRQNMLHINFVDERLIRMDSKELGLVLDAYFELFPEKHHAQEIHCFFDEIQYIHGWEAFVERLLRMEKCYVYLSGSSAKLLSKEIGTAMRGRSLSYEVFPFSFTEYLGSQKIEYRRMGSQDRSRVVNAFSSYLTHGGFPELFHHPAPQHRQILQDYYNAVVYRDVIERHNVSAPNTVSQIMHLLTQYTARAFTVNKLTLRLKSLGYSLQKSTVSECLDWLNDAYFMFPVNLYTESLSKQKHNPKKLYLIDNGICEALNAGSFENKSHLLENLVYMELRRRSPDIFYYKTRKGHEIDFVLATPHKPVLIQVSLTLGNPETMERESRALQDAMDELDTREGWILTTDEAKEIQAGKKRIHVMPVWKYLVESTLQAPH